ncbi:MAG: glutamate--tRNA ligase family protein [Desulfobacteraceae bacterium]|nr:glutamate--tRNA ligase family protein [Desulfobacteraceae bacterium]
MDATAGRLHIRPNLKAIIHARPLPIPDCPGDWPTSTLPLMPPADNAMMTNVRSRLAPTPSGYLHAGNAFNFLFTWLMTRTAGGRLRLRIDDADNERTRPEFVADIFAQLDWLKLSWDEGPSGPDDFFARHSQILRRDRYQELLARLAKAGDIFSCACSRRQFREQAGSRLHPGSCRERQSLVPGQPIRVRVPENTEVEVNGQTVALGRLMGDFVIWRRQGLPAYQLASLADDLDYRINLIVRGQDLIGSTAAQLFLASRLGETDFARATFVHHPLLASPEGGKLSKSHQSLSLRHLREAGVQPTEIYRLAAQQLGIAPQAITDLSDLLTAFRQQTAQGAIFYFKT